MKLARKHVCRGVIVAAVLVYVCALSIAIVGTQGLFETTPDGLAAVFLIFVGLPWSLLVTAVALLGMPTIIGQALAALFPVLNILLLYRLCHKPKV